MAETRAPAKPQSTALATTSPMPAWAIEAIGDYLGRQDVELLLPSLPVNSTLGWGHRPQVSVVRLSANPRDGDVFPVGRAKIGTEWQDTYGYAKPALLKMAEAAGVSIDTRRTDDNAKPDYCEFKAWGAMKNAAGQVMIRTATKAIYMPDIEAEAWRNRATRNAKADAKEKKSEAALKAEHEGEMLSFRKHLAARTETGAILRVIRQLLAIKGGLSAAEVAKPKVLLRVDFQPDPGDPDVKRFLLEQGQRATLALYGPSRIPERAQLSAAQVLEEPDDAETERAREAAGAAGKPSTTERPAPALNGGDAAAARRRHFAVCAELGVDTKDDAAHRASLAAWLGREVPTRTTLTAADWNAATAAAEADAAGEPAEPEQDWDELVRKGCELLSLSMVEQSRLISRHTKDGVTDLKAAYAELSKRVAESEVRR